MALRFIFLVLTSTFLRNCETSGASGISEQLHTDLEPWTDPENRCEPNQKCVPYYLCNADDKINGKTFLIDDNPENKSCPSLQRCCKRSNYLSSTLKPPTYTMNNASTAICAALETRFFPGKCGFRNKKGILGIARSKQGNVDYAQYAEFPWMMAILRRENIQGSLMSMYQSGGSLISPNVVLTIAYGIAQLQPTKLFVRAGEWDTQSTSEICPYQERRVKEVIVHENFTRQNLQNNLALLVLEEPFKLSPVINTVCLPPDGENFDNQRCLSSGWGKTKFGKAGIYQAFLKKVDLPIIPHGICQTQLRKTRLGEDFKLHDGFLCAGGEEGKDMCTGDGGSPLVCQIDSKLQYFYQAGIVSGGIECGVKDVPGFYTDVSKYRNWIDGKISAGGFSTESYTF